MKRDFKEFKDFICGKNVGVVGIGVSNIPLINFLLDLGAKVTAFDKKNKEENWVENLSLKEALKRLDERERNIVEMRFYEGRTQMEVAREIGISQAQVSRLEKHALKSMRTYLRA